MRLILLCSMLLASAIAVQARPVYEARRTYGTGFEVSRIDTFDPLESLSANGIRRIDAQNLNQWQVTERRVVETTDIDGAPITVTQAVTLAWTECAWDDGAPLPRTATQAERSAVITWQASQQAAAAAAEAERRAAPIVYEQSIETPSIILPSDSQGIGYEIFVADDGTLLKIVAHASPLKTTAERDALKAQAKAAHEAAKVVAKAKSDDVKDKRKKIKKAEDLLPIIEALQAQIDALTGGGQ